MRVVSTTILLLVLSPMVAGASPPADVILALDTSGGMDEETRTVETHLNSFAQALTSAGIDARFILIAGDEVCIIRRPARHRGARRRALALEHRGREQRIGRTGIVQEACAVVVQPLLKAELRADGFELARVRKPADSKHLVVKGALRRARMLREDQWSIPLFSFAS